MTFDETTLEQFTDIMVEKLTAYAWWGESAEDIFRQQVRQVIVDTELTVNETISWETWLDHS